MESDREYSESIQKKSPNRELSPSFSLSSGKAKQRATFVLSSIGGKIEREREREGGRENETD